MQTYPNHTDHRSSALVETANKTVSVNSLPLSTKVCMGGDARLGGWVGWDDEGDCGTVSSAKARERCVGSLFERKKVE